MSVVGEELYMSLRSTQIDIVGENIGVQHFLHDVRLVQHTEFKQGVITFAVLNRCTETPQLLIISGGSKLAVASSHSRTPEISPTSYA